MNATTSADTPPTISREVESKRRGRETSDGAGVRLVRIFDSSAGVRLDPFLLLDEFGSDQPQDYIGGFPDHPHRGFETVTYMLAGAMCHQDSAGHRGYLGPGSVQWMTAGRGIIHSEMPEQEEGLMRGFQLWVNLPAANKMDAPRYQDLAADRIPVYERDDSVHVRVIAGTSHGVEGAVCGIVTNPLYVDIGLPPGAEFEHAVPAGHNAFVYVFEGEVQVGTEGSAVSRGELAVLSNPANASGVRFVARRAESRLLLIAGQPIGEPVVQWGPFVMNTREEIAQAIADYNAGRLVS